MTKLIKCDGCEEIVDAKTSSNFQYQLAGVKWQDRKSKDFCPPCMKKLFDGAKVVLER